MALIFPNPSRNFDETKSRIQFWGYDRAIEVSFFVEVAALQKLCPDTRCTELAFLKAFDEKSKRIHDVADAIYRKGAQSTYCFTLDEKDF